MAKPIVTILLWLALTMTASAQGTLPCNAPDEKSSPVAFHIPLEVGMRLIGNPKDSTPFTASLRLHPSIGFFDDALRIGPSGGGFYENPRWIGLLGGRISYRLAELELLPNTPNMSFLLAGEVLARLGSGGKMRIGGALVISFGELMGVSDRGEYDLYREKFFPEVGIISDIMSWFPEEGSFPADTTHKISTLRSLYEILTIKISSQYKSTFVSNAPVADKVRAELVNTSSSVMTAGTIAAMKTALDNAGLPELSSEIDDLITRSERETQAQLGGTGALPNPIDERILVRSFIEGWCQALRAAQ